MYHLNEGVNGQVPRQRPLLRILLQALCYKVGKLLRDNLAALERWRWKIINQVLNLDRPVLQSIWVLASRHLVDDDAEGPDITRERVFEVG